MTDADVPFPDQPTPASGIAAPEPGGIGFGPAAGADAVRLEKDAVRLEKRAVRPENGAVRLEKADARDPGGAGPDTRGPAASGATASTVPDGTPSGYPVGEQFGVFGSAPVEAPSAAPAMGGTTVGYSTAPHRFAGPVQPRGGGATGSGSTGFGSAAAGTVPPMQGAAAYPAPQAGGPPRRSPVLVVLAVVVAFVLLAAVGGIWWFATGGPGDEPASVADAPGEESGVGPGGAATDLESASPTSSPTATATPTRPVQPSPETVWANLLDAPMPRLCGIGPGAFSDGVAGGAGGQAWLAWRLPGGDGLSVQQSTAFVDVTGDGIDDVAVVEQCNTGGDAWFDYIVFYEVRSDGGVRLLDGIGLVSVTSTARAYFDGFVAGTDGVVVLVNAGNGSIDDLSPWRTELGWTGSGVQVRYATPV